MRAFVVSRLFIVAFVCRGVLTTEVWAGDKISPDQATGLAKELESAIHAKDTVAAAALLDIDALVNRTLEGIPPSDFQRGYRSAFTRNRSGTIMGPLIKLA